MRVPTARHATRRDARQHVSKQKKTTISSVVETAPSARGVRTSSRDRRTASTSVALSRRRGQERTPRAARRTRVGRGRTRRVASNRKRPVRRRGESEREREGERSERDAAIDRPRRRLDVRVLPRESGPRAATRGLKVGPGPGLVAQRARRATVRRASLLAVVVENRLIPKRLARRSWHEARLTAAPRRDPAVDPRPPRPPPTPHPLHPHPDTPQGHRERVRRRGDLLAVLPLRARAALVRDRVVHRVPEAQLGDADQVFPSRHAPGGAEPETRGRRHQRVPRLRDRHDGEPLHRVHAERAHPAGCVHGPRELRPVDIQGCVRANRARDENQRRRQRRARGVRFARPAQPPDEPVRAHAGSPEHGNRRERVRAVAPGEARRGGPRPHATGRRRQSGRDARRRVSRGEAEGGAGGRVQRAEHGETA